MGGAMARRVPQAPARPSATNRIDRALGGAAGMSFCLSFHHGVPRTTGPHWLDGPSDLSCQDSTCQYVVDDPRLSCKQQGWGLFPPADGVNWEAADGRRR